MTFNPRMAIINTMPSVGRGRPPVDAFGVQKIVYRERATYRRSDCEGFHVEPKNSEKTDA